MKVEVFCPGVLAFLPKWNGTDLSTCLLGMSVHASMESDEVKFKRYLVREFFWQLAQHEPVPAPFAGLPQQAVACQTNFTMSICRGGKMSHLAFKRRTDCMELRLPNQSWQPTTGVRPAAIPDSFARSGCTRR